MQLQHISLLLNIPLLLLGFFLLNRGSGMLVDGATSIARRLKMPETMIHFTVVALGTSLPKLFTVLLAAYNGFYDMVIGTILGSCIFNLLGILSITGFFRPIRANKNTAGVGFVFLILYTIILYVLANYSIFSDTVNAFSISRNEGYILVGLLVLFMTYGYFNMRKQQAIWFDDTSEEPTSYYALWFAIILILVGILSLIAGGILVVDNLIDISRKFEMSQRFLGQFVLSIGGSAVMLYWIMNTQTNRSKFEVSNLLGQNMLNIAGMLGVAAIIQPISFFPSFNVDIFILLGVAVFIMFLLWMGNKRTLNIWKCRLLFLLLLIYVLYLFLR